MRSRVSHKLAASLIIGGLMVAACSDDKTSSSTTTAAPTGGTDAATTTAAAADPLAALYEECKANGAKVNLIALPDEWANYKGILQTFRDKYPGVENPVANPDASSKDEMNAVETLSGQADMPDNVDVSPAIAQEMVDKGLFVPYVLSSDAEIPAGLKDAANNWTAAYYGIMAIATNTTIVKNAPKTFADLTKRPA
jgi:putative spermidine/putrescine transport system substrate-binding protein